MYSTNDGRFLIVSRPSFKDVISLEIATGKIVWRFEVDGQRSDHMAISPDGKRVAVSASTGNVVHILDTATGQEVGEFPSGDSPHENTYSADGKRIYHASIGLVYTPADLPVTDTTKGDRYFQVVDAGTNAILSRVDMGQKLGRGRLPGHELSRAADGDHERRALRLPPGLLLPRLRQVRPGQRRVVQVVEPADQRRGRGDPEGALPARLGPPRHRAERTPTTSSASPGRCPTTRRSSPSPPRRQRTIINEGKKPYWSTTSKDGKHCFVSWSGTDEISILSYAEQREVANIKVGDHPQRIRNGVVTEGYVKSLGG